MVNRVMNIHRCQTHVLQRNRAPFPSDVWMSVKMLTFLCVLSADGSYLQDSQISQKVRSVLVNGMFNPDSLGHMGLALAMSMVVSFS